MPHYLKTLKCEMNMFGVNHMKNSELNNIFGMYAVYPHFQMLLFVLKEFLSKTVISWWLHIFSVMHTKHSLICGFELK